MPRFLDAGGKCGILISARDWTDSLGPVEGWSQSLKADIGLLLRSPVPMVMLWGPGRHHALQRRLFDLRRRKTSRATWPEVADFNDLMMRVGLAGETLSFRNQEMTLYRCGTPEIVVMDLDYSPVLGDDGRPAGGLAIVIETTARVTAEQALQVRAERLGLFDRLSRKINDLAAPDEIMVDIAQLLGKHMDASVVAYADLEVDQDRSPFVATGRPWARAASSATIVSTASATRRPRPCEAADCW